MSKHYSAQSYQTVGVETTKEADTYVDQQDEPSVTVDQETYLP